MVSFQAHPLSPNHKRSIGDEESENSCKHKRKWDDPFPFLELEKRSKSTEDQIMMRTKSLFDVELQLESPLPYEWQRCLDVQSGQIHFYNTRTHMKTSRDPRRSGTTTPEPAISSNHHMSLDLELSLRCDSQPHNNNNNQAEISPKSFRELFKSNSSELGRLQRVEQEQEEMVATVCVRCHMLVMLCKSSPSCPNCKYMHASDHQSTSTPFNKSITQGGHVASSCPSKIKAAWYN